MNEKSSRGWRWFRRRPLVTVLRLSGAIGAARFGRGLDCATLAPLIERAFAPKRLAAVALSINSPGGAAAQSALIARLIRDHAEENEIPVLAFCEDVAASGGYMLACAADEIYAEENSIIGSIGVISASFGFSEAISRLGVERRMQTSGENKARLDPFQPQKNEDKAWLAALQNQIHENFIALVKASRGERLAATPDLFTGDVWLGRQARDYGLIDGVGQLRPVLRGRFGREVRIETIGPRRSLLQRLTGASSRAPALDLGGAVDALESRALWARYGL